MWCVRGYLRWDIHTVGSGRLSSFLPHRWLIPFRGSWGEEFILSPGGRPPHLKSWRAQVGRNPEAPPATSSILLPVVLPYPPAAVPISPRAKKKNRGDQGGKEKSDKDLWLSSSLSSSLTSYLPLFLSSLSSSPPPSFLPITSGRLSLPPSTGRGKGGGGGRAPAVRSYSRTSSLPAATLSSLLRLDTLPPPFVTVIAV